MSHDWRAWPEGVRRPLREIEPRYHLPELYKREEARLATPDAGGRDDHED